MHNLFWRQHLATLGLVAQRRLVGQKLYHAARQETWFAAREVKLCHVFNSPTAHWNAWGGRSQDLNPEQTDAAAIHSMKPKGILSFGQVKGFLNPSLGSI